MSWWVSLCVKDKPVTVEPFSEGGTFQPSGSTEGSLNITYNYGVPFRKALEGGKGFRETLDGAVAKDVVPALERAVKALGTQKDRNYWKATNGNAGYALSILLKWAKQYPEAVFRVN